MKHLHALSELSTKLLKNVIAVLVILLLFALSDINSNFTFENMVVLLLTLGQAFFIEYLVHWRWNLFDISFDSVVKYFACGFFLTTPTAVIFEMVISTFANLVILVVGAIVVSSDDQIMSELETHSDSDTKQAIKDIVVNYPAIFIVLIFIQAFVVAALVEEMVKYFGYRMVVTPDLLTQSVNESPPKSMRSTGAGITVAMVSVALGFACCENLMYGET